MTKRGTHMQHSHQQMDDIQDAIDMAELIEAAEVLYPPLVSQAGVTVTAQDVIAEIACDRHPNESVARFARDPGAFLKGGEMVDLGPISASSFAVLVSALEAVAAAGHALDELQGKRI